MVRYLSVLLIFFNIKKLYQYIIIVFHSCCNRNDKIEDFILNNNSLVNNLTTCAINNKRRRRKNKKYASKREQHYVETIMESWSYHTYERPAEYSRTTTRPITANYNQRDNQHSNSHKQETIVLAFHTSLICLKIGFCLLL